MMAEFAGTWSYRSLINDPDLQTAFNDLQFGAGPLDLQEPQTGQIGGSVIRTVAHSGGQAPAGFSATFYAVRA